MSAWYDRLPFYIGCADAAHQVEGGLANDWTEFEERNPDAIRDRSRSGPACDHFHRYAEDVGLLAGMGANAYRFSIEWSRVEPEDGVFDHAALAYYRDVVHHCRVRGIEPVVTLHHFTLPLWLAERGGVLAPDAVEKFARYVAVVVAALGDVVTWWVTVNEPNVYAVMAYYWGMWPPQRTSISMALRALSRLVRMHAAAATVIRDISWRNGRTPRISIAFHVRPFSPRHALHPVERVASWGSNALFNDIFLRCCRSGRLLPPLGKGERVYGLRGSLDYLGVNHYNGEEVALTKKGIEYLPPGGMPVSTTGWAIDAAAFSRTLESLHSTWELPIFMTENGVADRNDELRPDFLRDHLDALIYLREAGIPLVGYCYWTLMDNFEWLEGYSQRFGLFSVDRQTLDRTAKPSASVFAEYCRRLAGTSA